MDLEAACAAAIDRAYASFIDTLPEPLARDALRLPERLGLGPKAGRSWGETFAELPLLGLPSSVLLELRPAVDPALASGAQRAHLFALLALQINVAIDAGQLEASRELDKLLTAIERERNRALAELRHLGVDPSIGFTLPEREVRAALNEERECLAGRGLADMARYLTISTAKQSLGFPALTAAAAPGRSVEDHAQLHNLILGAALGLQFRADLEGWLADPQRSSWPRALAADGVVHIELVRQLLTLASDAFEQASEAARGLGLAGVARWATREAAKLDALLRFAERTLSQHPGSDDGPAPASSEPRRDTAFAAAPRSPHAAAAGSGS